MPTLQLGVVHQFDRQLSVTNPETAPALAAPLGRASDHRRRRGARPGQHHCQFAGRRGVRLLDLLAGDAVLRARSQRPRDPLGDDAAGDPAERDPHSHDDLAVLNLDVAMAGEIRDRPAVQRLAVKNGLKPIVLGISDSNNATNQPAN